ncbi:MAG TPA: hypothetical protein VGG42_18845 [Acidobacteriaceae bacterium]
MIPRFLPLVVSRGPRDRSQFVVMVALAYVADDVSGVCWPKLPWIAQHSRMTQRGVLGVLNALEQDGWLTVERRAVDRRGKQTGGRGAQNRYRLNAARLLRLEAASHETRSGERRSPEALSPETPACAKPVEGLRKSCGKGVKKPLRGERASHERPSSPPHPHIGIPKERKILKATAKAGEQAAPVRDGDDDEENFFKRRPLPASPSDAAAEAPLLRPSGPESRARSAHLNREIAHA